MRLRGDGVAVGERAVRPLKTDGVGGEVDNLDHFFLFSFLGRRGEAVPPTAHTTPRKETKKKGEKHQLPPIPFSQAMA